MRAHLIAIACVLTVWALLASVFYHMEVADAVKLNWQQAHSK